ncbi:hypothetical protein [Ferrimonas balearica]|uniref:hypothetical protein n=1 Tax=Ferrimonas balearica TaxID=44012 RepID=UPI001F332202|nr:hypothetical protein [Ferrimonas balearica]MBY6095129.1 hypothetical protein [Ferrimonas balearica]
MSWIDDLVNYGGGLIESVGENFATAYGGALGAAELAAQPEVAQQREPVKAVDADGKTIVATSQTATQWVSGVSNGVVLGAGALLLLGAVLMARK